MGKASLLRYCYQSFVNIPLRVLLIVSFIFQLVGIVGIVGYLSYRSGQQSVKEFANQLTQLVLTLLVAVVTVMLSARWIARPIRRLLLAAVAIAQEQLDYPVETLEIGEVASLSNAFQGMVHQLQTQWNISEFQPVGRDINELKNAQEALRQSEQRFRNAFEDAPIGMSLVALQGQFIRVNRSLSDILGYSEDELLTKTLQDITHPDDLLIALEQQQKLLASEIRTYQVQKRCIHQLGHLVWVMLNVSLVRDNREDPIYFIVQIQDISDRYAIDRMKDEFISIVSHELRTPLTAIHGSLGILESGLYSNNPQRFNHLIQIALNNSDRLVRLVNDILDLERLESQKTEMVMEVCEVTDFIQQAVDAVEAIASSANIHLDWTPLPVSVRAAPDGMVQTLTNLLSNAIKFSPANSTVSIKAEVVEAKDWESEKVRKNIHTPLPYILFSIHDQGRGIPADKIETIFGRFQQVDVQDSQKKRGTGLGLAICKSIVQQHQGQIWVESALGAGSTFYFTLPCQDKA